MACPVHGGDGREHRKVQGKRPPITDIDATPFRFLTRWLTPPLPKLEDGEVVHLNVVAVRLETGRERRWIVSWANPLRPRESTGRLVMTDSRIVYRAAGRNPTTMYLTQLPAEIGSIDFLLSDVQSTNVGGWRRRIASPVGILPGGLVVDIETTTHGRIRFGLSSAGWTAATQSLIATFQQLDSLPPRP